MVTKMTNEEIRQRFVEVAPKDWDVLGNPNISISFVLNGKNYETGDSDARNSAAFALLKWLGLNWNLGPGYIEGEDWCCFCENADWVGTNYYHSDPVYAVMLAVIARLENKYPEWETTGQDVMS